MANPPKNNVAQTIRKRTHDQRVRIPAGLLVALGARLELGPIALEHHDDVVDGARNAAGKIAGAEGRHHRVLDDQPGMQVGQRAFQPIADLDAHFSVVARNEKQDAVVLPGLTKAPGTEQAVCVGLDRLAVEAGMVATTIWSEDFCSKASSFWSSAVSATGSISPALSTTRPVSAGSSAAKAASGMTKSKEQRRGRRASLHAQRYPLPGIGMQRRSRTAAGNALAAYPPCCCVPKSTFGGCMASSDTVKFWNGSLRNQIMFQIIAGKVLSEVL